MTILITGAAGLIGSHIADFLKTKGFSVLTPTSRELDISSKDSVAIYFKNNNPKTTIHCAAYTDVTGGENQRDDKKGSAWTLNVLGTENIVNATKQIGSRLIHISTDMVFSGKKDNPGPYEENHAIETNSDRLSWYGWTKAKAEQAVTSSLKGYSIVRISNPTRARFDKKLDYIRKILAAYDQGKPIRLFDDQHLTLTYVNEVSEAIYRIIEKNLNGIFHVSSSNLFTPYELAVYLLKKTCHVENIVQRSSIEKFLKQTGNNNRYAQFGGLSVKETEKKLNIMFRKWEEIIDSLIEEKM